MLPRQDMADLCGVSRMTIYRHIKELRGLTNTSPKEESPSSQCGIVLQMDATYWGQHFGALVEEIIIVAKCYGISTFTRTKRLKIM